MELYYQRMYADRRRSKILTQRVPVCEQRRPDPALMGPEMRQTFIMGLGMRSVEPLDFLGVRLPDGDWMGEMAPSHGVAEISLLCGCPGRDACYAAHSS